LKDSGRYIYNLVTKPCFSDKPTYDTLRRSLEAMRSHVVSHDVREIAMPKLCCGLDMLQWNAVRTLIKNVFSHENGVHVSVFVQDKEWEDHVTKPSHFHFPSASPPINSSHKFHQSPQKKRFSPEIDSKQIRITDMFTRKKSSKDDNNGCNGGLSLPVKRPKMSELADIFVGQKIFFAEGIEDENRLYRYVISHGGNVIEESTQVEEATHVVYMNVGCQPIKEFGTNAAHVSREWVVDSVRKQSAQPLAKYELS